MKKTPFLTKAMAEEVIRDIPTPFHIYDEKGIGIDVELTVMYDDSQEDNTAPIDDEILEEYIVAINETDGVVDIEYAM